MEGRHGPGVVEAVKELEGAHVVAHEICAEEQTSATRLVLDGSHCDIRGSVNRCDRKERSALAFTAGEQVRGDVVVRAKESMDSELQVRIVDNSRTKEDGYIEGYDKPGLHEPSDEDIANAVQRQNVLQEEEEVGEEHLGLTTALFEAIKGTADNPQEARFLEEILKQIDVRHFQQRQQS